MLQKFTVFILSSGLCWTSLSLSQAKSNNDTSPERYRALETLARGLFYLENLYVDPEKVKRDDMAFHALKGIVGELDPHTMIMPSKAFQQLTTDTQGKFGGVGIIVSNERGRLIVVSPIEDTPAHRAGIKSGDEIVAIDGVLITDIKSGAATDRMRGLPDTKLKLSIKREGEAQLLQFTLVREIIKVKSVKSHDFGHGILYARISSFQDNTADELKDVLDKHQANLKGLVLDLRDNPGGLLDQAVRVSDMFVESGLLVSTVGRGKEDVEREFATKRGTYSSFPVTVLINGGSASASEIVAGALQDHERGLVIGTTSFGKGSVQTLISLPDRSGLKITVARYYTPKDRSIQAKGIEPDVIVAEAYDKPDEEKDRKESDLQGHIESKDLSDLASSTGMQNEINKWIETYRRDRQLVTAYSYLRGWGLFKKERTPKFEPR